MNLQRPFARSLVTVRSWPFFIDMGVALCGLALFFGVLHIARYWIGPASPVIPITHSVRALPVYAFYSTMRIGIAYLLSLVFAIAYGYTAIYVPRFEACSLRFVNENLKKPPFSGKSEIGRASCRERV